MRPFLHRWLGAGLLLFASACSEERPPPLEPAGPRPAQEPVVGEWRACASAVSPASECRLYRAPLDRLQADGQQIELHVKRIPAPRQPPRGRVWVLQGGPGGSGEGLEGLAPIFQTLADDLDVMLPDHRGTGKSHRWTCPEQERLDSPEGGLYSTGEVMPCFERITEDHGADAASLYTASNAASDLGRVIRAVKQEAAGDDIIWGVSYGTFWAQRYLQLFPDQPTGVILDSIVPQGSSFHTASVDIDTTARGIFELCGADPLCSGKLGEDPYAKVADTLQRLDEGHCSELETFPGFMREVLASLVMSQRETHELMPAIVYRLDRCDPGDVAALERFLDVLLGVMVENDFSTTLRLHIGLSELYQDPPPTLDEVKAGEQQAVVGLSSVTLERRLFDVWPRYPKDELFGRYPETSVPVLALNGTLDAQTPIALARDLERMLGGANQTFVELVNATHGTINDPCGAYIQGQFLRDPAAPLDLACTAEDRSLDFAAPLFGPAVFGTEDTFENVPADRSAQAHRPGAFVSFDPGSIFGPLQPRPPGGLLRR